MSNAIYGIVVVIFAFGSIILGIVCLGVMFISMMKFVRAWRWSRDNSSTVGKIGSDGFFEWCKINNVNPDNYL
jgi:hypothetical protein